MAPLPDCTSVVRGVGHFAASPVSVSRSRPFLPWSRWYADPFASLFRTVDQHEDALAPVRRADFFRADNLDERFRLTVFHPVAESLQLEEDLAEPEVDVVAHVLDE